MGGWGGWVRGRASLGWVRVGWVGVRWVGYDGVVWGMVG